MAYDTDTRTPQPKWWQTPRMRATLGTLGASLLAAGGRLPAGTSRMSLLGKGFADATAAGSLAERQALEDRRERQLHQAQMAEYQRKASDRKKYEQMIKGRYKPREMVVGPGAGLAGLRETPAGKQVSPFRPPLPFSKELMLGMEPSVGRGLIADWEKGEQKRGIEAAQEKRAGEKHKQDIKIGETEEWRKQDLHPLNMKKALQEIDTNAQDLIAKVQNNKFLQKYRPAKIKQMENQIIQAAEVHKIKVQAAGEEKEARLLDIQKQKQNIRIAAAEELRKVRRDAYEQQLEPFKLRQLEDEIKRKAAEELRSVAKEERDIVKHGLEKTETEIRIARAEIAKRDERTSQDLKKQTAEWRNKLFEDDPVLQQIAATDDGWKLLSDEYLRIVKRNEKMEDAYRNEIGKAQVIKPGEKYVVPPRPGPIHNPLAKYFDSIYGKTSRTREEHGTYTPVNRTEEESANINAAVTESIDRATREVIVYDNKDFAPKAYPGSEKIYLDKDTKEMKGTLVLVGDKAMMSDITTGLVVPIPENVIGVDRENWNKTLLPASGFVKLITEAADQEASMRLLSNFMTATKDSKQGVRLLVDSALAHLTTAFGVENPESITKSQYANYAQTQLINNIAGAIRTDVVGPGVLTELDIIRVFNSVGGVIGVLRNKEAATRAMIKMLREKVDRYNNVTVPLFNAQHQYQRGKWVDKKTIQIPKLDDPAISDDALLKKLTSELESPPLDRN